MNDLKRRMKMMEERQHAKDIIKQFDAIIVKLDNGIDKCREKAKECLIERNDMNGFRMFGRSMKYYGNMKSSIEAIKCQFENYLIQVEVADSFVGLKDVIGKTAKMMDTMPSLQSRSFQRRRDEQRRTRIPQGRDFDDLRRSPIQSRFPESRQSHPKIPFRQFFL